MSTQKHHTHRSHLAALPAALAMTLALGLSAQAQGQQYPTSYGVNPHKHPPASTTPPAKARSKGSSQGNGRIKNTHQANAIKPVAPTHGTYRYGAINPAIGNNHNTRQNLGHGTGPGYAGPTTPNATTPGGGKTSFGGSQTITGPNGKSTTVGGSQKIGTGGIGGRGPATTYTNGAGVGQNPTTMGGVNAQGDHQGGVHLNNGGSAGASDSAAEINKEYNPLADKNGTTTSDNGTLQWKDGNKWSGTDSDGLTWNKGRPWNGPDGDGGQYQNGHHVQGMHNSNDTGVGDDPDLGSQGPGSSVSGTGKGVSPGNRGNTDAGGGRGQDGGASGGGTNRNNATGGYVVTGQYGQDAPKKAKDNTPLDASKLTNGASDPKRGNAAAQAAGHGGG